LSVHCGPQHFLRYLSFSIMGACGSNCGSKKNIEQTGVTEPARPLTLLEGQRIIDKTPADSVKKGSDDLALETSDKEGAAVTGDVANDLLEQFKKMFAAELLPEVTLVGGVAAESAEEVGEKIKEEAAKIGDAAAEQVKEIGEEVKLAGERLEKVALQQAAEVGVEVNQEIAAVAEAAAKQINGDAVKAEKPAEQLRESGIEIEGEAPRRLKGSCC